jgi:uncharacterized protein with ParB-like and HNH nuclease domain
MKYATKIYEFFYNPKAQFIIPLYQRAYAWDVDNCKRLFDDIIKVYKNELPSHFFGSIVSVKDNEIEDDVLIIDGQQRITTVSIIVIALYNAVKNNKIKSIRPEIIERRISPYLYAEFKTVKRNIKLKPIERDIEAYDALFSNDIKNFVSGSGITNNYEFFYEQILRSGLSFEDIFESLEKLVIIDLRLESSDNPQLIFESLNSTGKDLTEADKVRNYLLMSLNREQQDDYYHKYWTKIEAYTDNDPSMFIRDYLTIKLRRICNINNIYFYFKDYDENNGLDREQFFKDLLYYAEYYRIVVKGEYPNKRISRKLKQLASIGTYVGVPFYLMFFNYANEVNLGDDEIYKVLDITEGYWARRIICGYPANVMQKVYATLHFDVMRIFESHKRRGVTLDSSYSDILKYILLKKQGNAVFPKDDEVVSSFATRQIYKLPIDYRCFLFERMENGNSVEGNNPIVYDLKHDIASIEHIMPQTLTRAWEDALGGKENAQRIKDKYLHTFANLTLTGYNTSYSNHIFSDKKKSSYDKNGNKIYGYDESKYNLSDYLKRVDQWTETEMINRGEILLREFLELWPMIQTKYTPLDKEVDSVSFDDDDYELKSRLISSFEYKGVKYEISTWKDMLIKVCQMIYQDYASTMIYLSHKNVWFFDKNTHDYSEIANGCFVYSACNTQTKKVILQYLFENCSIPESDLIFNLVPINNSTL